jgi:HlyD family secretion protein
MIKKLIAAVVILGLLGAGAYAWVSRGAKPTADAAASSSVKVAKGSIFQAVSSTGRVVSNLDVDIKCKASGEIIKLPFDISQEVKKGDLLLEIDPVNQKRSVDLANVEVSQSEAKLAQAEKNLEIAEQSLVTNRERAAALVKAAEIRAKDLRDKAQRRQELLNQDLGSVEDFATVEMDAAQAENELTAAKIQTTELKLQEIGLEVKKQDVTLAKAQLDSNKISLAQAQQTLLDTKVISPMDGVVSALSVQKGMIIASAITNVGGGSTVLTLSDLSRVFVLAAVDESDIGKVTLDQKVNVTADSYPGTVMHGKVVRIATRGVNVSNVVTFEVKIEVTGEKKKLLKPEMIASVQIISAEKDDVLVVPTLAVTRKGRNDLMATVIDDKGVKTERKVEVGLGDGERWEVTNGLAEGDTVVMKSDEAQSKWRADQARQNGPQMGLFGPQPRAGGGGGGGRR